ncbi:MAG: four helix bundle protein [Cytophagaceae bacterium]
MFSYQKLEVYQKAFLLNRKIYGFLKKDKDLPFYIKNQLGKASLSIVLNIAEGSAKFGKKDRRNFFVISRGSAFEWASIMDLLYEEKEISIDFYKETSDEFETISRLLFNMIKNLEN